MRSSTLGGGLQTEGVSEQGATAEKSATAKRPALTAALGRTMPNSGGAITAMASASATSRCRRFAVCVATRGEVSCGERDGGERENDSRATVEPYDSVKRAPE